MLWLVSFFYDSIIVDFKKLVSTIYNDEFYDREPSEAFDYFDQLDENKSNKRPLSHLMLSLETPFPIQLKGTNNLYVKLASLVRKVEYLKLKKYMS